MMKTFIEFYYSDQDLSFKNLTLYHGSNVIFDVFDFEKFGQTDAGTMGPGFYLTGKPADALRYAENAVRYRQSGEPHVLVFEVSANKTLVLDSNNTSTWEAKMHELGVPPGTVHENSKALSEMGYDSVAVMDGTKVHEMLLMKPGMAKRIGIATVNL